MTQLEPRTRRKLPIVAAVVVVVTLGGAIAACAAPGNQTFAANDSGNQPQGRRPPALTIQPWPNPNADYITLAPSRTVPIPGSGPNPTALAPPDALPDPYANPQ